MTNKPRVTVTLDADLLNQIDDYRYNRRISTQSKAVQQLVKMGFQSMENDGKSDTVHEGRLDRQERELLRIARELDPSNQELLLQIAEIIARKDAPRI